MRLRAAAATRRVLLMGAAEGAADGRKAWDGARLREIRIFRGMSQADLAAMSRIGKSEISRHERNAPASNPTIAAMGRLSIALDVELSTLFQPVGAPIGVWARHRS
jgi:transcriptional regulator with XRE-family HTH domain